MDGMMRILFTFVTTRSLIQRSAPPEKVNQDAMISSLGAWPGGGGYIAPIITAQKLGQDEQTITDLQNQVTIQRQTSLSIDGIVDRLNDGYTQGKIKDWTFISYVFDTGSYPELRKSIARPGKEKLKAEIEKIIGPPSPSPSPGTP